MDPLKNKGFDSCVALNTTDQMLHICLIFTTSPKKARQALVLTAGLNREVATKDLRSWKWLGWRCLITEPFILHLPWGIFLHWSHSEDEKTPVLLQLTWLLRIWASEWRVRLYVCMSVCTCVPRTSCACLVDTWNWICLWDARSPFLLYANEEGVEVDMQIWN